MKLPAFTPDASWTPPKHLFEWTGAKRIAVDVETKDPHLTTMGPGVRRADSHVIGVSVAIEDGPSCYLPIGHLSGNMDPDKVWSYLRDQSKKCRAEVTGANLQYDMDWLARYGVDFYHCRWRDVQIAEPIIDELQYSFSLDNIARKYKVPGKDESTLRAYASAYGIDPKKQMWMLPAHAVGAYAEYDARLPLIILRRQEKIIEQQDLRKIFDLECRLQPVLVKMRRRGVRVDFDRLDEVERWALSREVAALHEVTRLTGIQLSTDDTNKTFSLAPVLRHVGIDVPKTAEGKDSVTKDFLVDLKHPVGDLLRTARKFNKLRTTFAASIREHAIGDRIHCTFNQLRTATEDDEKGARYGRLSCTNPNLQQQPARDEEIGPRWRSIYVPEQGAKWACLDYSQQEPRWLTHYAELLGLPGAQVAAEKYRTDPTTDNHQMMAELCKIPRKPAKELFLGKCYGMGGAKLCHKLGLPTEWRVKWCGQWLPLDHPEAKDALLNGARKYELAGPEGKVLIDKFNEGAPYVNELAKRCEQKAQRKGFIITAGGRRCRFPTKPGGGFDWAHKALNRLIQGSSGDQSKTAMVLADEAGIELQLQVHDELDLSFTEESTIKNLAQIMCNAMECRVPAKVDIETGESWGEIE